CAALLSFLPTVLSPIRHDVVERLPNSLPFPCSHLQPFMARRCPTAALPGRLAMPSSQTPPAPCHWFSLLASAPAARLVRLLLAAILAHSRGSPPTPGCGVTALPNRNPCSRRSARKSCTYR